MPDTPSIAHTPRCEEGHCPYPDECVRLVVGVIAHAATTPSVMERVRTYLAVSTRADLVNEGFKRQHPGFVPLVALSLDDVRFQVQQLRDLRAQTLNERSTIGRIVGKVLLPFEHPYLVSYRGTMGQTHRKMVMASSQINARKAVVPMPYAGMAVPLSLLEDLLNAMDRVKTGEMKAPYLWDYSKDGDYFKSLEKWSSHQPADYQEWKKKKLEELAPRMSVCPETL